MIDQNICDRVIQHVCKHKPHAPMLLAIYADRIETVFCTMASQYLATKPIGMDRQYEALFAKEFALLIQSKGRPLYLAQASVVSLINDVGNPTSMHVCITDTEGNEQISYMGKLKSCLCCYDTLTASPGWKGTPFMLGQVVMSFRLNAPTPPPAPVYAKPASEIKFSKN
jgi:hypothetical protein